MILIIAKALVKNGCWNDFKKTAKELVDNSRMEKGCLEYSIYKDKDNNSTMTFVEKWKDNSSLKEHEETQFFKEKIDKLEGYSHEIEISLHNEVI